MVRNPDAARNQGAVRAHGAARRRVLPRVLLVAALSVLLSPLTCSGIHDDELRCEEAAAHLQRCCPNFDPASLYCTQGSACGGNSSPQLQLEQSECILGQRCEDLTQGAGAQGSVCARALVLARDPQNGALRLCP